jgi:hypothetical protein
MSIFNSIRNAADNARQNAQAAINRVENAIERLPQNQNNPPEPEVPPPPDRPNIPGVPTPKESFLLEDVNGILGNLRSFNSNIAPIISRESQVKTITDTELERLNAKKIEVDDAYNTNKRLVDLNDSYRKKQSKYNYMMFIVISFFVIMLILIQIQKAVPIISGLLTMITVILAIVVITYVLFILADIYRRDPNDFDKINYNPPPGVDNLVIDPTTGKAVSTSAGLINPVTGKPYDTSTSASRAKNVVISSGQDACFAGQSYDYYSGKCIPNCSGSVTGNIRNMGNTELYDADKKLDYTKINALSGNAYCVASCPSGTKVCGNFCIPSDYSCGKKEGFENYSPFEFSGYASLYNKI